MNIYDEETNSITKKEKEEELRKQSKELFDKYLRGYSEFHVSLDYNTYKYTASLIEKNVLTPDMYNRAQKVTAVREGPSLWILRKVRRGRFSFHEKTGR